MKITEKKLNGNHINAARHSGAIIDAPTSELIIDAKGRLCSVDYFMEL